MSKMQHYRYRSYHTKLPEIGKRYKTKNKTLEPFTEYVDVVDISLANDLIICKSVDKIPFVGMSAQKWTYYYDNAYFWKDFEELPEQEETTEKLEPTLEYKKGYDYGWAEGYDAGSKEFNKNLDQKYPNCKEKTKSSIWKSPNDLPKFNKQIGYPDVLIRFNSGDVRFEQLNTEKGVFIIKNTDIEFKRKDIKEWVSLIDWVNKLEGK